MRKASHTPRRRVCVLLGIGCIWCLCWPYFIMSKVEWEGISVTRHNRPRRRGEAWTETARAEDIMRSIVKFADDLLNIFEASEESSQLPVLKDYKGELRALQIKMEAEREKAQQRDEMIKELLSDKLQLRQQVSRLEELLMQQAEKDRMKGQQVKSDPIKEDKNCPLPPMDGYLKCKNKIKRAVVRESLAGLYPSLESRVQFSWVVQRIRSMEEIWIEAGRSLSAKHNLTQREAKQILVHPGALTDKSGMEIAKGAFSGGPLGELVQWSDLISTLHILVHHLHLSASVTDLKVILGIRTNGCPGPQAVKMNLIYTDITGLHQIQAALPTSRIKYKCIIRVLDSFGTEPDFNHAAWAQKHHLKSPFGGLNLIPMQFNTMFPHTPDNTFLGFVVQHQLSTEEAADLKSTRRRNQALVYGKHAKFWQGKDAYLDIIHKYLEIHGTADSSAPIPSYVKNHGIVKGTEVQTLLRQSKVFVGLSFPYEGPAPLEALANGCAFLNPRLNPPLSSLNSEFFKTKPNVRELTSQHPYAEAIGEPYVWTVDMHNSTDVERALTAILNQTIEPYLPYEFTCEGMLQRVNALVEKQDFCSVTTTWPPLSALQVVRAKNNTSCKQACQEKGLICEPAFFMRINNAHNLASHGVDCQTSDLSNGHVVLPAHSSGSKHCHFQSDPLLFSCVRSDPAFSRICPCRDYIKDQIALCAACT